jgi:hypothetical protein
LHNHTYFRDQSELACNVAIGVASLEWVGVPLALIWYQLPEILSSVEHATLSEPFSRFLATQLHFIAIYEVS